MEPKDLSANPIKDVEFKKGTSLKKSETSNERTEFPISVHNNSTQSNNEEYAESGQSSEYAKGIRRSKVQEGQSPVEEDLESNISLMVGDENLKTRISITSTDSSSSEKEQLGCLKDISQKCESEGIADFQNQVIRMTQGSNPSSTGSDATCNSSSSEEKPLGDLEDISEKCQLNRVLQLENPILWLHRKAIKKISNSQSTTSFSGSSLDNATQTTKWAIENGKKSFQDNSISMKLPEVSDDAAAAIPPLPKGNLSMHNKSMEVPNIPPLPKGKLSMHNKSMEVPTKISLSSLISFFLERAERSNENIITVPPFPGMAPFPMTREVETTEISDCWTTIDDYNSNQDSYCQKEDKSVRRKVKTEPQTSSETDILSTSSSAPTISYSSRKVGRPLQEITKTLKKTSPEEQDWDIYENCGATSGFIDYNSNRDKYSRKEDKSVRRKMKSEPPTSSETDTLSTSSSAPVISGSSRNVGRTLLEMTRALEKTSPEVDCDLNKNSGRMGGVNYVLPKIWIEEFLSLEYQATITEDKPSLDADNLLKEIRNFFQNNCVDADVNMSREECNHRIITSKYLSDEFAQSHGLATHNELMQGELDLLELCKTLVQCSVDEEDFIECVGRQLLLDLCNRGNDIKGNSDISNPDHVDFLTGLFCALNKVFDYFVMVKLYAKLAYEGATYLSILSESKKPTVIQNRFQYPEIFSTDQNSSQDSYEQSTVDADYQPFNGTLTRNETGHTGRSSSSEADVFQKDESATKSSKTHSKGSKESSKVASMSNSNVLDSSVSAEQELRNEKSPFSKNDATENLESINSQRTGKVGSNVSAEDFDSTMDRKDGSEE